MGLRGPHPKPRVWQVLEGNPGKRPLNPLEPQPLVRRPKCPDYLDGAAKKEWKRLVPVLEAMRVLTEADGIALGNLCMQYAMLQEAQTSSTVDQVNKLCREFGLTPAARTRIQVAPGDSPSSDPLEDALCD